MLKEKYPTSLIFFITPLQRVGQENPYGENGKKAQPSGELKEYVDALIKVVNKNELPLLNLFEDDDFSLNSNKFNEYISADGLHPTNAGHDALASKILAFLKNL